MAIGFARVEFVKRSLGKNACAKAAYNSRSQIHFEGNLHAESKNYNWKSVSSCAYHDILLPAHVDLRFKNAEYLWNTVEKWETKVNAQVAIELVLALPDEAIVSLEDRIELVRDFIGKHFVDKGLAAQIDIHAPERRLIITRNDEEAGLQKGMAGHILNQSESNITFQTESGSILSLDPREFSGYMLKEHNWHAHILITTRRFKSDGLELEDTKARDLMPRLAYGKVHSGSDWGKLWAQHQNLYFEEKGIDLRVDPNGLIPQEHLGPHRIRGRAFSLYDAQQAREEANLTAAQDPKKILEAITSKKSVFTREDVTHFLDKHVPAETRETITSNFWQSPQLVRLIDKNTGKLLEKYSSQEVVEEEQQILRIAERLQMKHPFKIKEQLLDGVEKELNPEQSKAFQGIVHGPRLSLIQGYAGTGKSHLLKALDKSYTQAGYRVRAFGPDSASTDVLTKKGLSHTENIYKFLFALHHDQRKILKGKEVWILDEAGKLGNLPLLELLKEAEKCGVQLIFSGDAAQLPPVDRGGMFKVLCHQYGAHILADIQRQKNKRQKEIARSLATGDFGSAIDQLSAARGIIWSENKQEAMESLITRWALDVKAFGSSSALIIAHSNAEIRVLNEMARFIRRQRGELTSKEFECITSYGTIYVSVGDIVEFRRNDKNGIFNGLSGTLIEADKDRFVVSVRSKNQKQQTIVFNPQEYQSYQLGYASTNYRAQGRTIDRAYVLHSPRFNKEMFYVGLTRHVRNVSYYLSKDEVYCLADLKRLALRSSEKILTVDYTTQEAIQAQAEDEERLREIHKLKESEFFLHKVKGFSLQAWDRVKDKMSHGIEKVHDRVPNKSFYSPEVPQKMNKEPFIVREVLEQTAFPISEESHEAQLARHSVEERQDWLAEQKSDAIDLKIANKMLDLSSRQQDTVKAYLTLKDKASALKCLISAEAEVSSKEIRLSAHFNEWRETCGKRDRAAWELLGDISSEKLKTVFNVKDVAAIQAQANQHNDYVVRQEESSKPQLDEQLKAHLEPLLHCLYPEGPSSKSRTHFRFGSKGSLSVVHSGSKAGQFYDFEQQHGGGLLKLIQRNLGLGKMEAKNWAHNFLGTAAEIPIPKIFLKSNNHREEKKDWVSLPPLSTSSAPQWEEFQNSKLSSYFTEVGRHAYKDENGQLLYYVLRLRDKNDPKKKITPPLSYGYWKSNPEKIGWELKKYHAEKNSLYNLHLLKKHPSSPVLIVEGEKTADLAVAKFLGSRYVAVTWPGGAGAASKADWTPLLGRSVFIWPDNDKAGQAAAECICHELRKVGVASLQMVDKSDLEKSFPTKWDLADDLPTGVSPDLPLKLLASSKHKGVNPQRLMHRLGLDPTHFLKQASLNEILWRVDERLRPSLEEAHGVQFWKIEEEILKEAAQIVLSSEKMQCTLKQKLGVDGAVLERLNYQICIFEAQKGRDLRLSEIDVIRNVIHDHYIQTPRNEDKEIANSAIDRLLTGICDRGLNHSRMEHSVSVQKDGRFCAQELQREADHSKEIGALKQNELVRGLESRSSGL